MPTIYLDYRVVKYSVASTFALCAFLCATAEAVAAEEITPDDLFQQETFFPLPNTLALGPEIYLVKRTREGGTEQNGWLYGGRASYDRIKRSSFYWGANLLYASGNLKGRSGSGINLSSNLINREAEGRFGYTFQSACDFQPSITPFIVYGYYSEVNKFDGDPYKLDFEVCFPYAGLGLLSSVYLSPSFALGFNVKAIAMYGARALITNYAEDENFSMIVRDKINYRIELPLTYRFTPCTAGFEALFTPFYEHKHYGGRLNFPYDFIDTTVCDYGFNLLLNYRF